MNPRRRPPTQNNCLDRTCHDSTRCYRWLGYSAKNMRYPPAFELTAEFNANGTDPTLWVRRAEHRQPGGQAILSSRSHPGGNPRTEWKRLVKEQRVR